MAVFDRAVLAARYYELCEQRDQVNAALVDLQAKLELANAEAETARVKANAIAAEIQAKRGGGEAWLALKKEIADIARFFGTVPPKAAPRAVA